MSSIFNDFFFFRINVYDKLEKIREKYKNHLNILAILQQQFGKSFSLQIIPEE